MFPNLLDALRVERKGGSSQDHSRRGPGRQGILQPRTPGLAEKPRYRRRHHRTRRTHCVAAGRQPTVWRLVPRGLRMAAVNPGSPVRRSPRRTLWTVRWPDPIDSSRPVWPESHGVAARPRRCRCQPTQGCDCSEQVRVSVTIPPDLPMSTTRKTWRRPRSNEYPANPTVRDGGATIRRQRSGSDPQPTSGRLATSDGRPTRSIWNTGKRRSDGVPAEQTRSAL